MRVFGLLGLVLALVIVGVLVKKQLTAVAPAVIVPSAVQGQSAAEQSRQVQEQIKQSLDAAGAQQQQRLDAVEK